MEHDQRNGSHKRLSGHRHIRSSHSVERRSSKKSNSEDRHGRIYPDTFRGETIRTVTPDSPSHSQLSSDAPASESENPSSSATTSPRSAARGASYDRPREQPSSSHPPRSDSHNAIRFDSFSMRPRTKTLDQQRSASPTFVAKSRQRVGSMNVASSPGSSQPEQQQEDGSNSIGYPSIVASPPLPPTTTRRQRLAKDFARQDSTSKPSSISSNSPISPIKISDPGKILQLMKITCGRMHGILSFKAADSHVWTSGYCAINVGSGSLIYQAKGDPASTKTLISDLRGCQVRTLTDTDTDGTYLNVSTYSSQTGIHLRPHVPETFDSWLAALLCWQPIRPKGHQNKMTKPQSTIMTERRNPKSRRNSQAVAAHKESGTTIMKMGKMLFWDKQFGSGIGVPFDSSGRRVSTYKQQRALSPCWRKVSCTLHENGHFKLYFEPDSILISTIQLSSLSRCAIQKLDPSVLEDEFCIAIYPQYSVSTSPQSFSRPVYLSMESRVLFEVWYVLLRAFTVPELYGPKQTPMSPDTGTLPNLQASSSSPSADLFRVERQLSIRIIEARLYRRQDWGSSANSQKSFDGKEPAPGDYYAEVTLDGEVRAKTALKINTSTPFWREDYEFPDLPPVTSSFTVGLKKREASQRDWILTAHGPYALGQGDMSPMTILGDIEISSHDATFGKVSLEIDDLERGLDIEKWWPVIDDNGEQIGELLMRVRAEEFVILMSDEYRPLSELLHRFSNGLTVQLGQVIPTELNRLAHLLVNIFQVSGKASEWIMALVEDEIDGLHRETSININRLRFSRRLHSNESYETGPEREIFVREFGRSATAEANLLFRGNSLLTKALDLHMRRLGKEYLEETLGERIRDIDESDPECEVDPVRVRNKEYLDRNWRNLMALTNAIWKSISTSASRCPPELRLILRHIRACADDRYGDYLRTVTYSSVSGFLFLRFFCPAVLNPKLFGLLKDHPRPRAQRTLTLIAKTLQGLANLTTFGGKEPWMEPMNSFIQSHRNEFKSFIDQICSIPSERPISAIPASYATPIGILARLPPTSREGFPSLPFLIDHARNFAGIVQLWLEIISTELSEPQKMDGDLLTFHKRCVELQKRAKDCLAKAEQAERPSVANLETRWEEMVDQLEHATFFETGDKKSPAQPQSPYQPQSQSQIPNQGTFYNSNPASPVLENPKQRSNHHSMTFVNTKQYSPKEDNTSEETSTGSPSDYWPRHPLAFPDRRPSEPVFKAPSMSSSDYSLEKETSEFPKSPSSRDGGQKSRFTDFMPGFKKKGRDRGTSAEGDSNRL
ncbi:MAG: hypothetical protein M1834_008740 [Cirrosporium novae-zelandiae]|nr:MAG: hypothetical protein M1834_008740 [Cirrosporium novae-zelandiae]